MTKDEALKLALEALETLHDENMDYLTRNKLGGENNQCMVFARETITAIKEALAQPEQEPVAWMQNSDGSPCPEFWDWLPKAYNFDGNGAFTKYNMEVAFLAGKQASQPVQRKWVGLTDEEVGNLSDFAYNNDEEFVRNVEAKLKEKNT